MRDVLIAGLIFVVAGVGARAEDTCATERARMGRVSVQYNAMLDQLRSARRELGSFAELGEEAKLRAVRQYGLLQRDADAQRNRILEVYEGLLQRGCNPFDQEGYDRTVSDFRRVSGEERDILADAKKRAGSRLVGVN
jgi:hypothetical protein